MIYKGPDFDKKQSEDKSTSKKTDKKVSEVEAKKQAAALELLKDYIQIEKNKRKPKILWFASGCLLLVIIVIVASTVIPLLLMISDAKDTVKQNLDFIKNGDFDQAVKMCDLDFFAEDFIIEKITAHADMLKKPEMNAEFKNFADLILKENTQKNYELLLAFLLDRKIPEILKRNDWLDILNKMHLHGLEKLCDFNKLGKQHFTSQYKDFNELLKDGSFEVQEFSTAQKQATVQGEIFFSEGKRKFFTFVLYYDNDDEIWYIIRFRFGQPKTEE